MLWSLAPRLSILALLSSASLLGMAQTRKDQPTAACPAQPSTVRAMRNCYRPLLVFAPALDHAQQKTQFDLLKDHAADLKSRAVLYVPIVPEGHNQPIPNSKIPTGRLSEDDLAATRLRFKVAPEDFLVVLIGKDGGEKLQSTKPVTIEQLKHLIDSMPMRQEEMKPGEGEP
jgi:uncharacterized protein DUF4174